MDVLRNPLGNAAFPEGTDLIPGGNLYSDLTMRRNWQLLNYGNIETYPGAGGITHRPGQGLFTGPVSFQSHPHFKQFPPAV